MPTPPPAGSLYDKAFRKHARQALSAGQYAKVHARAFRAAGGMAPRKAVEKLGQPARSDVHVDAPIGAIGAPNKKKKLVHAPSPALEWTIAKAALAMVYKLNDNHAANGEFASGGGSSGGKSGGKASGGHEHAASSGPKPSEAHRATAEKHRNAALLAHSEGDHAKAKQHEKLASEHEERGHAAQNHERSAANGHGAESHSGSQHGEHGKHEGHEGHEGHGEGFNLGEAMERLAATPTNKSYTPHTDNTRPDPDRRYSGWDLIAMAALTPSLWERKILKLSADLHGMPGLSKAAKRRVTKALEDGESIPLIDPNKKDHVVYCVALEPHTTDAHADVMTPEEIQRTAHKFVAEGPMIGSMHGQPINAVCVESYVAPMDMHFESGMYGPQTVTQGSWVLGIKIKDPKEWQKIVNGEYTGISVGGFGLRDPLDE